MLNLDGRCMPNIDRQVPGESQKVRNVHMRLNYQSHGVVQPLGAEKNLAETMQTMTFRTGETNRDARLVEC